MQLSPLQSRLAASMIASILLLIIYFFLFSPQFALAAEFDPPSPEHVARELAYEIREALEAPEELDLRSSTYEPEFALFDRSIIGRAAGNAVPITNNKVEKSNIAPGTTMTYVLQASSVTSRIRQYSSESAELRRSLNESQEPTSIADDADKEDIAINPELMRRQQSSKKVWISANTCEQPWRISSDPTSPDPPQLTLYVSTSPDNTSPGPSQSTDTQKVLVFNEGAVMFNVSTSQDVYMSVSAPDVSSELFDTSKQYNFELVASTDQYYYSYREDNGSDLIWVDSDGSAALLQTNYLTNSSDQTITEMPYVIFAHNNDNLDINGMRNSYCGLSLHAQIRNLDNGSSGMVTMGLKQGGDKNLTRQEFYVSGLNASTNYTGILARPPGTGTQKRQDDSSSVGGGIVFQPTNFSTKANGACTFIFNLTLCTDTQYAVPGNLKNFPNATALASFYENYTQTMWDNFDKALQQVPCEAASTAQYSLARNCNDCKNAYKNWLCSVAIPRCEDFSSPDRQYLQIRNVAAPFSDGTFVNETIREKYQYYKAYNSSRNPIIDEVVQPGPYKEILPCDDLCYELVQTLEQRRRNAKFVKEQDARRGKSETEIKKRTKDVAKSPISPFWLGILGFIVFGGLIFEVISRIFFR
ncbi:stretch-activated Ca2+-permeable channel component-domain-containing protein [Hypoxylon trugodes]|uniref:stretch-activated Ca2+-permeable channel component-domain-containing protein n=1 Tax=Hypoxylon trugodes TaxID=326681 RepID=UPI002194B5EA|nr:stretch-activated Ca2+-permeable channel component-domain-containing protein [Hypoxylon trugodes]KAI1391190.1 stretch-activated Ca2+-permeable channel component-domain-containing protein [Hypoxylon trugodes]